MFFSYSSHRGHDARYNSQDLPPAPSQPEDLTEETLDKTFGVRKRKKSGKTVAFGEPKEDDKVSKFYVIHHSVYTMRFLLTCICIYYLPRK